MLTRILTLLETQNAAIMIIAALAILLYVLHLANSAPGETRTPNLLIRSLRKRFRIPRRRRRVLRKRSKAPSLDDAAEYPKTGRSSHDYSPGIFERLAPGPWDRLSLIQLEDALFIGGVR